MSLLFIHVRSFACRGRLRTFRADCSIISLCCVTTTWQLLFPSGYGRRRFVACDCWTQTSCAVSAARQWLLTAVCHVVLYCVKRSIAVPTKRIFRDCCRNMGHFLSGVERAKRFVNVLSHRTVTNLKKIREMSTLPPLENFLRKPMATSNEVSDMRWWSFLWKIKVDSGFRSKRRRSNSSCHLTGRGMHTSCFQSDFCKPHHMHIHGITPKSFKRCAFPGLSGRRWRLQTKPFADQQVEPITDIERRALVLKSIQEPCAL